MQKPRLLWLDAAKALAILLTITGHTINGAFRDMIYSFHMPLFFMLSGYTFKPLEGRFLPALRKDFKRLAVPVLFVCLLQLGFNTLTAPASFPGQLKQTILSILWGNGCSKYSLPGIGIVWFLTALFLSKQLYRLIAAKVTRFRLLFLLVLAFCGMYIGRYVWLPQSLDLVLVSLPFLEAGSLYRRAEERSPKALPALGCLCFCVWAYATYHRSISLEMAIRYFPFSMICLLVAAAGSIWVIQFVQATENFSWFMKPLAFLGRHSLALMCVHALDDNFCQVWDLAMRTGSQSMVLAALSLILRIVCDILILLIWLALGHVLQKFRQKHPAHTEK